MLDRLNARTVKVILNTLLILAFLVVARHSWQFQKKSHTYQEQIAELEAELDAMRREAAVLRERVMKLESDPGAVERLARERLGMMAPGEVPVEADTEPSPSRPSPVKTR
ncbi:septum formation initiator family protein [bacterium]|nr:septum formation initiator family protein [bacterium]